MTMLSSDAAEDTAPAKPLCRTSRVTRRAVALAELPLAVDTWEQEGVKKEVRESTRAVAVAAAVVVSIVAPVGKAGCTCGSGCMC